MYKNILVCLDNSDQSNLGMDIGIAIAAKFSARLTGCHVYAAVLHENRFRQMEFALPAKYQKEDELNKQRNIHSNLITKGLRIIADSYITAFEDRCKAAGVACSGKTREGKNYLEIVGELEDGAYDLVILGSLGVGATGASRIGSVCERVARRTRTDILVVREAVTIEGGITAAVDGSPNSFAGIKRAVVLAMAFGARVEAVSVYDPHFHYAAFKNIAGILSEEAGRLFRFKEQEMLHGEIIDTGLAKIYRNHLDISKAIAQGDGMVMETTLLEGKPYDRILQHLEKTMPGLLIMGRNGIHGVEDQDIGSNTENCLRQAGCNVLITSQGFLPPQGAGGPQTGL
ncbi:MAG: universal stress protein [Deltaproteobacteria bacterium]|nr:universal stress protein [Deltaproteobacteria bacterium]